MDSKGPGHPQPSSCIGSTEAFQALGASCHSLILSTWAKFTSLGHSERWAVVCEDREATFLLGYLYGKE